MTNLERLKWKALLIILLTFAVGAMTGAALNGIYLEASSKAREGHSATPVLDTLRRDLNLTEAQAVAIRSAIEDTRRELRVVRFDQCPGFTEARRRLIERVRPLLTPEQQQRFSAIVDGGQLRGHLPRGDGR